MRIHFCDVFSRTEFELVCAVLKQFVVTLYWRTKRQHLEYRELSVWACVCLLFMWFVYSARGDFDYKKKTKRNNSISCINDGCLVFVVAIESNGSLDNHKCFDVLVICTFFSFIASTHSFISCWHFYSLPFPFIIRHSTT